MNSANLDPAGLDPMDLAQPYAERLAEDERLRGQLTDSGFGPLLDWLTNLLIAAAGRIAMQPDAESMMDQAGTLAHGLGQAIVVAAERADPVPLRGTLREPLLSREQIAAASAALPQRLPVRASADDRARRIVAVLAQATGVEIGEEG